MKKLLLSALAVFMLAGCSTPATTEETPEEPTTEEQGTETPAENTAAELPAPRDTTKTYKPSEDAGETACTEDVYTTACSSIGADNLYEYLGRDDVVYIDLRDYADYAKTHLRNFEVVPYFAVIFNENAGTEGNPQLFGGTTTEPVAAYEESVDLLEAFIPKDKTVFLMCQSGGRVAQMMQLLEANGYDMSKIYNVGGMAQLTDSAYAEWTTNTAELTIDATYSFTGLTPVTAE